MTGTAAVVGLGEVGRPLLQVIEAAGVDGTYVTSGTAVFNGTVVQTYAATTVTLGSLAGGSVSSTAVTGGTLAWTPALAPPTLLASKCSTTSLSASGSAF